jgi:O-antigen/teichoic acid export membrane protein
VDAEKLRMPPPLSPPAPGRWRGLLGQARRSEYVAGVAKLATGAALAQAIGLAAAPVITRLYTPADYGVYASFAALAAIAGTAAALRYDLAVVLPERDEEAAWTVGLCLGLIAAVVAVLSVALGIAWVASPWLRGQPVAPLLWLLPPATAFSAAGLVAASWANRKRAYGALARVRVAAAVLPPAVSVGTYFIAGSTALGLTLGWVAGLAATLALSLRVLRRAGAPLPSPLPAARARWGEMARRYRQFPRFNLGMTVLEQLTASLPVLAFATLFSPAAAAWFALANNVLRMPAALVGQALSQVFYERAARLRGAPHELRRLLGRTLLPLAGVSAAVLAGALLLAPAVFSLVFGREWAPAGEYARLLAPSIAVALLTSPVSLLPAVLGRQQVHLAISLLSYAARVAGIAVGVAMGSAGAAVLFYALGEVVVGVAFLGWLWRASGEPPRMAEAS